MRRLFAANVLVVLLGPWIAALSGVATPAVVCPMHHASASASLAEHNPANGVQESGGHQHESDHETTARGCNCVGECGRSGAAFSLAATDLVATPRLIALSAVPAGDQSDLGSITRFLPLATGPPQRLRA
ncbi:MAG: hypothetical protein ACJ8AB_14345 [Gemmatimonadaceae bacterium]